MLLIIPAEQILTYLSEHGVTSTVTQYQDVDLCHHGNVVEWKDAGHYYRMTFSCLENCFEINDREG